jgi:hypothetical protein
MTRQLSKIVVSLLPPRKIKKKQIVKRLPPISDEELNIYWGLLEGKLNTQVRKPI